MRSGLILNHLVTKTGESSLDFVDKEGFHPSFFVL